MLSAVFIINMVFFNGQLNRLGIWPRETHGLAGIALSPLLHLNINHLLNNLVGLGIFALLTMSHGLGYFWRASAMIILLGGFGVWLLARPNIHIGASGWIFGLWSLNIVNAWYNRSFKTFVIALVVIIVWGGMILGVLPSQPGISFEAHLFGALAGVAFAAQHSRLSSPRRKRRR
ncbi:MAG TPA: rhomboid family intramembrane serine protease [Marinagarivorans sp.]